MMMLKMMMVVIEIMVRDDDDDDILYDDHCYHNLWFMGECKSIVLYRTHNESSLFVWHNGDDY